MKHNRILYITFLTLFISLFVILTFIYKTGLYCPIHELIGIECPFCGATRCVWAILNLEFNRAFLFNPWFFCLIPYFLFVYIRFCKEYIQLGIIRIHLDIKIILATGVLFMIYRNIFLETTPLF